MSDTRASVHHNGSERSSMIKPETDRTLLAHGVVETVERVTVLS